MRTPTPRYDLEGLVNAVGLTAHAVPVDSPRDDSDEDVTVVDEPPLAVTDEPLEIGGYVDGIQRILPITYVAGRPIVLVHAGAAAVDRTGRPLVVDERAAVICAEADLANVDGVAANSPPVRTVADGEPWEVESAVVAEIAEVRRSAERAAATRSLEQLTGAILVDGSVVGWPRDDRVVGVAKSVGRRWLPDERLLYELPPGWRSPRFEIGGRHPRASCYLRLVDAGGQRWSHGLVRLEAHDLDTLGPLAAAALQVAQRHTEDPRWDRHLAPVAACEDVLRSRVPTVFSLATGR